MVDNIISKLTLLDKLYLHTMITDGKRRKSQAFSFSVFIFDGGDLLKSPPSDWLYVEITKDLKKRWGVTIYGWSKKLDFL